MKNVVCLVLLLLIQLSVKAQTEKGRWNAGVSIGSFSYQKYDYGNTFSGSINPTVGYFVASNLLVGTGIPVSHTSQNYSAPGYIQNGKTTTIGVSPFARYYVGSSKLKPYIGLAYTFSHNNSHSENSTNTPSETNSNSNATTLTPSIGVAYFLNRNISLDAQLGYNWYSSKTTFNSVTGSTPTFRYTNVTLGIGFNIFFGG
ncbi:outer membrane beta-barrel protein [Spirosoma sp. HMF4905]|uniref:Outer membrane beta-barrel protein n=1 Tax=Spirosoma arboris TaxID=2682092 RepID=A0A7K1SNY7_9BACT|nr:outer membrane beta-barrel protein [Spirosoma arboris]MVM35286.1 outer membrane beta-barrel protein [Spirosoma arboris]